MKIEKLSENQIRCTLNKSDLAARQLKISELAYGSEKAKKLFQDMMQQASYEFGFEAEDIPLLIRRLKNHNCYKGRRSGRTGYPFFQIFAVRPGRRL